jgi:hypothetical protein
MPIAIKIKSSIEWPLCNLYSITRTQENRSLSAIEPVSAPPKRKLENRQQRPAPKIRPARIEIPAISGQRLVHPSLTRGNDGDSPHFYQAIFPATQPGPV